MSIEIIWGPPDWIAHCAFGVIEHSCPRPDLGEVGPLMLAAVTHVAKAIADGPLLGPGGALHSVTVHDDRKFAHIESAGARWTWELTWRPITTTDDLSAADLAAIANTLEYWKACGEIEYRCRRIGESLTIPAKTEAGQR